jgi:hypothetical protein
MQPAQPSSTPSSSFGRTPYSNEETTLHDVLLSTRALVGHLDKFGVYDMDRTTIKLQPVRGGDLDEVELVLGLREKGRLFLKAGTEVGGGEGGGVSLFLICYLLASRNIEKALMVIEYNS